MDKQTIINLLHGTLDPGRQQEATNQLDQMHKIIGFSPLLLEAVMSPQVEMPTRQSGAIYLKNLIGRNWEDADTEDVQPGEPQQFNIHEQDRAVIRDAIVDAAVHAPDMLRQQLATCIKEILKLDFPDRWTNIVDKVSIYLQTPNNQELWYGALTCLYQMAKVYEYREEKRRLPFIEAMGLLLPLLQQRLVELVADTSEPAVLTQKLALKIFFRYIHHHLPLNQLTRDVFTGWMELVRRVAERAVPAAAAAVDEDERPNLCWWKCRKWSLRLLCSTFDRYGRPGQVIAAYEEFANWYMKAFTPGTLKVVLDILESYRSGQYLSPKVLQQCLDYLDSCVPLAYAWKLLRSHMLVVIKDILFPLMCFNDKDALLWDEDPHEFVRLKYDMAEECLSPVAAARALLDSVACKRKGVLKETMAFVVQLLTARDQDPRHLDGALHLVGTVSKKLLKKDMYKDQMELMLVTHVFPHFRSQHGFLRARACWVMETLSSLRFQSEDNLAAAVGGLVDCLLTDTALPVQVEAAMSLATVLEHQSRAEKLVEPHLRNILIRILDVIRSTDNLELTEVVQQIVRNFSEQLVPVALELATHLLESFQLAAATFTEECDDGEKQEVASGLVSTMDLLMDVWEEQPEITSRLEPLFLQAIVFVLENNHAILFEETFQLVTTLTIKRISPEMWRVFELMYKVYEQEGNDYFDDMMPALHNYITVDVEGLLADPARLSALFNMCKSVLTDDEDQFQECHAVKLLECMVLQCAGRITQCVPSFAQLIVERMTRQMDSDSLRVMCLQLLIAVLYTEPQLLLETFSSTKLPNSELTLIDHFIKQWISDHDKFTGIHDRKMFVLGWCVLMRLSTRPGAVDEATPRLLPTLINVLDALKRAYQERALEEEDSDADDDGDVDSLDEDEDEIDEEGNNYLEMLQKKVENGSSDAPYDITAKVIEDEDSDDDSVADYLDHYEDYTTPLDAPDCPVDEFVVFRETLETLQQQQPDWYRALSAPLDADQLKLMQEAFTMAEHRQAAAQAEAIKKQGGYNFEQKTVPNTFNFGSPGSVKFGNS